jgi:uncharacterized protein (TIGR03435 family)
MALAAAAYAQPAFEVATVKLSTPPDYAANIRAVSRGGPGSADPGRWSCEHMPLSWLITAAWQVQPFQLSAPAWMENTYVEITAKLPPGATRDDLRRMQQALLRERFRMEIKAEKKEVSGYELGVMKDGPKLAEAPPLAPGEPEVPPPLAGRPRVAIGADGYPDVPENLAVTMTMGFRARRRAIREDMDTLARNLSAQIGKPVENSTGLKGKYNFTISWIYDGPGAPSPPPPGDLRPLPPAMDPSGPTVFKAIQEQLGLKLEPKKVAVDFLTIERAERRPTEN